jgi:putative protein kinase ArgK-like GTPase of G3E family
MKLSKQELEYCKSITDNGIIEHLRGKIYFNAGTYGITFMKRGIFDFADIYTINDFRNKTLSQINNELKL